MANSKSNSTDLNIIVCVDPRRCLIEECGGRNGADILADLRSSVADKGLGDQVQVTPCRCIFGCTYGPRIDVIQQWSGEKLLYGSIEGEAVISRRGRVRFSKIPDDLGEMIQRNLPPI